MIGKSIVPDLSTYCKFQAIDSGVTFKAVLTSVSVVFSTSTFSVS